jgi:hypothetical protein
MSSKDSPGAVKGDKNLPSALLPSWHLQTRASFINRGAYYSGGGKIRRNAARQIRMCFAANLEKETFSHASGILCYHLNVTMETRSPTNKLQSYFLKIVGEKLLATGYLRTHRCLGMWRCPCGICPQ